MLVVGHYMEFASYFSLDTLLLDYPIGSLFARYRTLISMLYNTNNVVSAYARKVDQRTKRCMRTSVLALNIRFRID